VRFFLGAVAIGRVCAKSD